MPAKIKKVKEAEKEKTAVKSGSKIGIYKERSLHAALKSYFEPDTAKHEQPLRGFIADIINDSGVTEIQTRAFYAMKKKLEAFLCDMPVTVVYPVARQKWLIWINGETGEATPKRRSPKVGQPYELFFELYGIKQFLLNPNLRIKIIMVDIEEYRILNGWSRDKKRGSTRCERVPVEIGEEIAINCPSDFNKLIPPSLPEKFYVNDFSRLSHLNQRTARTALNILTYMGTVVRRGRDKKGYIYNLSDNINQN